jgi:GNAT superfamily N-acetyltransferase
VLYLEDIVVREALRGNGIGKLLLEACVNECRAMGYKRLTWQVLDWNEPAIRFYERWNAEFDAGWLNASIDF